MEIVNLQKFGVKSVIFRLRQVPLMGSDVKPYAEALISLEHIRPDQLAPAQNYVWLDELRKVQALRAALAGAGVEMFNLNGFVSYMVAGTTYHLYPPIVEESIEDDGTVALIINDGLHRLWLARQAHIIPQVVYIRGLPNTYPYYAYPRPEGWAGIEVLADNPGPNYLKKCHRHPDYKRLYRDFQAVFANVGRSRGDLRG